MQGSTIEKKNILVTGARGFIGKNLVKRLEELVVNVYGSSHTQRSNGNIWLDVSDYKRVHKIIKENKIDICFHLAGESIVESGQKDPYHTLKTNIEGTLNVLESVRLLNLERVIIASTAHVYGNNIPPFKEDFFPRPSRPYETSKACADLISQSYADTFALPVLIPRFTNIYGPGDTNFGRLIPSTIKSVIEKEEVKIWGGNSTRDYLYIDDAINAYIKLATMDLKKLKGNRIFNFGASERNSVDQIVKKIVKFSHKKIKVLNVREGRPNEVQKQYVSYLKARRLLGWEPVISINEGLKRTYDWYSSHKT